MVTNNAKHSSYALQNLWTLFHLINNSVNVIISPILNWGHLTSGAKKGWGICLHATQRPLFPLSGPFLCQLCPAGFKPSSPWLTLIEDFSLSGDLLSCLYAAAAAAAVIPNVPCQILSSQSSSMQEVPLFSWCLLMSNPKFGEVK